MTKPFTPCQCMPYILCTGLKGLQGASSIWIVCLFVHNPVNIVTKLGLLFHLRVAFFCLLPCELRCFLILDSFVLDFTEARGRVHHYEYSGSPPRPSQRPPRRDSCYIYVSFHCRWYRSEGTCTSLQILQ